MACSENSTSSCGCTHTHSASCSFYKGASYSCIPVTKGMDLEDVISNIADYICSVVAPPSGHIYTMASCDDNITVTTTEANSMVTNLEVCLNPDIITNISNNTSSIATINACLLETVKDLTSSSITITESSSNSCGRTLQIEYNPSGTVIHDGIIYNNTESNGTNGGGTTQTLKSFNWNYDLNNSISVHDEIRIQATGKTEAVAGAVDTIILDLYDATGAVVVGTFSLANATNLGGYATWVIDAVITVTDVTALNGTALFSAKLVSNFKEEGLVGNTNKLILMIDDEVTNIDWTNLTIRVRYDNVSTATAADNYAKKLMVEVVKFIG